MEFKYSYSKNKKENISKQTKNKITLKIANEILQIFTCEIFRFRFPFLRLLDRITNSTFL